MLRRSDTNVDNFERWQSEKGLELPHEDEERLEKIFCTLDKDGNGKIDVHDLSNALKEFDINHRYAEKFIKSSDRTQSGDVSLVDFIQYVREHEKNLRLYFSHLDKNQDGKIDLEELIKAFKDLGLPLEKQEALKLLQRMDQDGSLNISYDEWRDFLLLAPGTDIHQILNYWRHSTVLNKAIDDKDRSRLWDIADQLENVTLIWRKLKRYLDVGEDMNVPDDFTTDEMQSGMWWRHLLAGGFAGAVSRTCTAPFDRLKVFLQVQPQKQTIPESLRYLFREGGVSSFWRGNGINVLKIAPESAIKFAAYEQIKRLIKGEHQSPLSIYERFCAGALAGGISQSAIYPLEVLKTRLALRKTGQYKGILDAAVKIYTNEGLKTFYRGYLPNILGIAPYAGIDLAVYETLKRKYLSTHPDEQPSFLMLLACGSASCTLGQICSYPLALVRTRLQAHAIVQPTVGGPACLTMSGVFRSIVQTEGFVGLYRGITPNFIKVLPAVSISYVVYEYTSRLLGVNMT